MDSLTGLFLFGVWLLYFIVAFILMGIVYLTGWRKSPKWMSRFWWITFGLAGVFSLLFAFRAGNNFSRGVDIVGFFVFIIVALLLWGFKRGRSSPRIHAKSQPPTDQEVIGKHSLRIPLSRGIALALVVTGLLILLDRMGSGYGLREGWPWMIVALGVGIIFRNKKSLVAWVTTMIGIIILGSRYYSIHISFPAILGTYFLPILLIIIGVFIFLKLLVKNDKE